MSTTTSTPEVCAPDAEEHRRNVLAALRRAYKTPQQIGKLLFHQLLKQNPEKALRILCEQR